MARIGTRLIAAGLLFAGLVIGTVAIAAADDETGDVEIKIQGPLEAVSCDPAAPTITVLGLQINIATASLDGEGDGSGDGGGSGGSGGDGEDGSGGSGNGSGGCAALVVGQTVEVKLANDTPPLAATEVSQGGEGEITIKAPIQAVDSTAHTVTVLGLGVDLSQANMEGAEDDSTTGQSTPIDVSQLMVGQFIELRLMSSQPPLVATNAEVKNFGNQVEVDLEDQAGGEVDDTDSSGNPVDDVDVEVDETVSIQDTSSGVSHKVKKVLHFHKSSNGGVVLTGVPTGRVKIRVTRTANGATSAAKKGLSVKPNIRRIVKLRLRAPR